MSAKTAAPLYYFRILAVFPAGFYSIAFLVAFFENTGYFYIIGSDLIALFSISDYLSAAVHEIPGTIFAVSLTAMTFLPTTFFERQASLRDELGGGGVRFDFLGYSIFIAVAAILLTIALFAFRIFEDYVYFVVFGGPCVISVWYIIASAFNFGSKKYNVFFVIYVSIFLILYSFFSGIDSAIDDLSKSPRYRIEMADKTLDAKILRSTNYGIFILKNDQVKYINRNQIKTISGDLQNVSS